MNLWLIVCAMCFLGECIWRHGYFFWLTLFAGFAALVLTEAPIGLSGSFFGIFGTSALLLWRLYLQRARQLGQDSDYLRDAKHYRHHVFTLSAPMHNGQGQAMFAGSVWSLRSDSDIPQHTSVVVYKTSGATLFIKPAP